MRGLMFTGELAQGVYEGTKTETRRPENPFRNPPVEFGAWIPGMTFYARERFRLQAQYNTLSPNDSIEHARNRDLGLPEVWCDAAGDPPTADRWGRGRPSIHMPSLLCRSILVLEELRREQLHAINDAGAVAEGFACRADFVDAWITIYGKSSWNSNPVVRVIRFKRTGTT